jgi:hypothetical protein
LPWYLRNFNRTGWWQEPPPNLSASIIIASPGLKLGLDDTYQMGGNFELRPQVFLQIFVERSLWDKSVKR